MPTVYVSEGAQQFVTVTLTESTGKDISSATVQLSLGSLTSPGDIWVTPEMDDSGNISILVAKWLLTNALALGTYYIWAKIVDSDETTILRCSDQSVRLV